MKKEENKVMIVDFSSYSRPEVIESAGRKYVSYGEDNNYYQYLIDRANGSPTNNSLITGISDMIYGEGLAATDSAVKPDEFAQMKTLFKKETKIEILVEKIDNNLSLAEYKIKNDLKNTPTTQQSKSKTEWYIYFLFPIILGITILRYILKSAPF